MTRQSWADPALRNAGSVEHAEHAAACHCSSQWSCGWRGNQFGACRGYSHCHGRVRVRAENFSKVGLFPDYGGTYFAELVGPSRAAELFYTGEMIDAKTAHRIGVVNHVYSLDRFEAEMKALAKKIADGPQVAIRAVKHNLFARDKEKLLQALELEVQHQMKCFHSEDCREGIRAFMEKRAPKFVRPMTDRMAAFVADGKNLRMPGTRRRQ